MNRFASTLLRLLDRVVAPETVSAHCDIPCGIYDPHAAQVAALTVLRMDQLIKALDRSNPDQAAMQIGRYTLTKEAHAEICKRELDILWHDYFRPEHLEKYPDLHTKFWNADKLASRNKQSIDEGAASDLLNAVNEVAEIFWGDKEYPDPAGTFEPDPSRRRVRVSGSLKSRRTLPLLVVSRLRPFCRSRVLFFVLASLALLSTLLLAAGKRYVVDGRSMLPTLKPGDGVVVNRFGYRFRRPRVGEIVVLLPPDGSERLDLKRITAGPRDRVVVRGEEVILGPDEWFVEGDNAAESSDSRQLGPVRRPNLIGPVLFSY